MAEVLKNLPSGPRAGFRGVLLGHAAGAVGAPDDGRVAAAVLGAAVVATLGRHLVGMCCVNLGSPNQLIPLPSPCHPGIQSPSRSYPPKSDRQGGVA